MSIHDGALDVLCIVGIDEASVLVLERARPFAEAMGARIHIAGVCGDCSSATHHLVELSAMLGRAFDTAVDYVRAEAEVDPCGQDVFALAADLKSRRADIVAVGLASGCSRVPSALARDIHSSLLLVPLRQRLLH